MLVTILIALASFAAGYVIRGLLAVALERQRRTRAYAAYEQDRLTWSRAGRPAAGFPSFETWQQRFPGYP